MTRTKILRRLSEVAPVLIAKIAKPGPHCVLSCAVGQMVLQRFGLEATPFPAEVSVANQEWIDWSTDDFNGGAEEQMRLGAYLLTNRPQWDGGTLPSLNPTTSKPWDGHLALRLADTLIDLDLASFARPTKGIVLPAVMVAPIVDDRVVGSYHHGDRATMVQYAPLVAPYADDYQSSRDWVARDRYADVVAGIVKRMKESKP